jgi:uncharacterized protein YjbI with pentapeptide repeats
MSDMTLGRWITLVAAGLVIAACIAVYALGAAQGRSIAPPWLLAVGVLAVLVLVVFVLPPLMVSRKTGLDEADRLKAINDIRTALAQALGGAAVVGTLYFTAISLQDNRDATTRSLELNRQGQLADRFTNAVKELGDSAVDVRVGAIYALEQVAFSSQDDRSAVIDILTSYLRDHDRWQPGSTPASFSNPTTTPTAQPLQADFQAALTVLGRRQRRSTDRPLELMGIDLGGGDLRNAHLENADLYGAHFDKALLNGAHLDGAILYGADLTRAVLAGTDLTQAVLDGAVLTGATLEGANLTASDLTQAVLVQADLKSAVLDRADLTQADLSDAQNITRQQLDAATGTPRALPPMTPS